MKTHEKKAYETPSLEVLVVELEQGIAAGSLNSSAPLIDDSFGQGSGSTGWNDDNSGF